MGWLLLLQHKIPATERRCTGNKDGEVSDTVAVDIAFDGEGAVAIVSVAELTCDIAERACADEGEGVFAAAGDGINAGEVDPVA
jgi:hypothetical protein